MLLLHRQSLLAAWFDQHEDEWKVLSGVEVRVRVAPDRVRTPDVVVDHAQFWPETLIEPPLLVMEILSPSDTYADITRKIRDYLGDGDQDDLGDRP